METVRQALLKGASLLPGSETPFLDASVILSGILEISKEKLFAMYPDPVPEDKLAIYYTAIEKRRGNYPVSYITGKKEFFGLTFLVDERVLCPRPDTETLVEKAVEIINTDKSIKKVLDLCTGSGCIGISIKAAAPGISITCADISSEALEVCGKNTERLLKEPVELVQSDLFDNIRGTFDMIVTNPPYVRSSEVNIIKSENSREPSLALDGGEDGLDLIRRIIDKAPEYLSPGGIILLESAIDQTYIIEKMLKEKGFHKTEIIKDLSGRNRVTVGRKKG